MDATHAKPPVEVVLPLPYYIILAAEVVGLAWFFRTHEVSARDPIGQAIGWVGTASMLLMHVYSLRKRVRRLFHWGKLRRWLEFHIFLGLQGAMLVTFHSLHLSTLSNISGLTIVLTLIVVGSGVFGRYLFSMIPKNLSGERLSAREVEAELEEYKPLFARSAQPAIEAAMAEVTATTRIHDHASLFTLVREDLQARRAIRHLKAAMRQVRRSSPSSELEEFLLLVQRRGVLARRLAMLTASERLFRNWTVLHKPLTYVLFGMVVLHIVSHYIYGAQFGG